LAIAQELNSGVAVKPSSRPVAALIANTANSAGKRLRYVITRPKFASVERLANAADVA